MTQNVLLTGGFGTLGGRIAHLLAKGSQINLRLASRGNQSAPTWAQKADTFQVDFESTSSIKKMLNGITHVVHLVALNDYESRADPVQAQHVNVEYTRRLIEHCAANTRFIYLSTIQVYGSSLVGLINEDSKTNPTDSYGQTHLDAENLVKSANEQGLIQGVSLRSANGFGAPMSKDAKIWQIIANDLCRQAVEIKKLTLRSHGLQARNFLPFTDTCLAVKHCLEMNQNLVENGTFNLGSEQTVRVLQLAELIVQRTKAVLKFEPNLEILAEKPQVAPEVFTYDSAKLKKTGLALTTSLESEIDHLLVACQNWFSAK